MVTGYISWAILAGLLLAGEMATGTFYLLLLALGATLAGLLAWLGAAVHWQLLAASLFSLAGVLILQHRRKAQHKATGDDNLDIGNPVNVLQWTSERMARVRYRGSEWDAQLTDGSQQAETLFICGIKGNLLLLSNHSLEK